MANIREATRAGDESVEVVSRWLGHANVSTTDAIYAHRYPSDYSAHMKRFETFVGGAR